MSDFAMGVDLDDQETLKPCPFCGGEATAWVNVHPLGNDIRIDPDNPYHLECSDCFACGPQMKTAEEAVTMWNTRREGDKSA